MRHEDITYEADGRMMIGYLAVGDESGEQRPGVLVSHEGPGLTDHARRVADRLAGLGYIAFALDYHGGGTPPPMGEAMERLGELMAAPERTGAIAQAGLDVLLAQRETDASRIAAIGFCFGGVMSLELARSGADVNAVVGLHPGFRAPQVERSRAITASVLMCCGTEDPFATAEQRAAFEGEMRDAEVSDWRLELYGGVGHSFTNPAVDELGMPGLAYDAAAERRSWRSMVDLFDEVFGPAGRQ